MHMVSRFFYTVLAATILALMVRRPNPAEKDALRLKPGDADRGKLLGIRRA